MACHYSGRLNKGRRQGQGRYDYGCGFVYTGDWHEGMKHGQGRLDLPHGAIYEGSFVQGEIQGKGCKRWPNGSSYEGEFYGGEINGHGIYCNPKTGEEYEGWWVNNHRNGLGRHRDRQGDLYVGNFDNNHRSGEGQLVTVGGTTYRGGFKSDEYDGHGTLNYPDGNVYEGDWKEGKRQGHGRYMHHTSGLSYEGPWLSDVASERPNKLELDVPELNARKAAALEAAAHSGKNKKPAAKNNKEPPPPPVPALPPGSSLGPIHLRTILIPSSDTPSPSPSEPPAALPNYTVTAESESGRLITVTLHKQDTTTPVPTDPAAATPPSAMGPSLPFLRRLPQLSAALNTPSRFPPAESRLFFSPTGQELDPSRPVVTQDVNGVGDIVSWMVVNPSDGHCSLPTGTALPSSNQQWAMCLDFRVGPAERKQEEGKEEQQDEVVHLVSVGSGCSVALQFKRSTSDSVWLVAGGKDISELAVGTWHSMALVGQPNSDTTTSLRLALDGELYDLSQGDLPTSALSLDSRLFYTASHSPPPLLSFTINVLNIGLFSLPLDWSWAMSYTNRVRQWYDALKIVAQEESQRAIAPETPVSVPGARQVDRAQVRTVRGQAMIDDIILPPALAPGTYVLCASDQHALSGGPVPPAADPTNTTSSSSSSSSLTSGGDAVFQLLGNTCYVFMVAP